MIDFYASWCGHCQVFAPVFETLAGKLEGRVRLGKVNCEHEQYLCQMANIRAFPTIRFYQLPSKKKKLVRIHNNYTSIFLVLFGF